MWIQVPDSNPMMGGINPTTDPSVIQMAKAVLKEHKAERKRKIEEDKKKEAKNKPKTFTFLETWGLVLLLSIPVTLGQLYALDYARMILNTAFNGTPH